MVPLGSSYHPDLKILTVLFPRNFLTSLSRAYYNQTLCEKKVTNI